MPPKDGEIAEETANYWIFFPQTGQDFFLVFISDISPKKNYSTNIQESGENKKCQEN